MCHECPDPSFLKVKVTLLFLMFHEFQLRYHSLRLACVHARGAPLST